MSTETAGLPNVPGVSTDSGSKYREMLSWLYQTQRFGIKLGLDSIRRILHELEVPAKGQQILHVAGTNGKGSVCAMMAAICRAQGYRTGLFISPHLITYRERIQVDGLLITHDEVAAGLERIRRMIRDWDPHPTFFEITTALALVHFKEQRCEVIVLETGLGGRLDATNAVAPVVSVITPIGYDHQKWLGNTLAEIAGEKAGIIKPGVPVVSAAQEPEAENVLRARAAECGTPIKFTGDPYARSPVALLGAHQRQNAAVAIEALRAGGIRVDQTAIERGLESVEWPARFQRWDERVIIDGAHNPGGAESLARTWREFFGERRATIILAVLADKDAGGICRALAPIAERFLLTPIRGERALPPADLAQVLSSVTPSLPYSIAASLDEALRLARAESHPILITGSLHFAGEAIAFLSGDMAAFEECAQ